MKKIFLITLLIGLVSCGTGVDLKTEKSYRISASEIGKTLNYLASDELEGRMTGSAGIEMAAQYIERVFKEANLRPYYKTYRDSFENKNLIGYNLLAYKEGIDPNLKDELVILGAHYDHIGIIEPVEGDSIANGANDDASGTTAVLELAKYFADKKTKRSILFALFSGEEMGMLGSSHLAKRLKEENAPIYVMLNFEMMGVPMKRDFPAYLTGYNLSNLAEHFNQHAGTKVLGNWEGAETYQLFRRSDNYSFYQYLDIPAHTLSSFDFENFDHYHKVGDEAHLMDFHFMEKLIVQSIPGIEGILNADEKIELKPNP